MATLYPPPGGQEEYHAGSKSLLGAGPVVAQSRELGGGRLAEGAKGGRSRRRVRTRETHTDLVDVRHLPRLEDVT